MATQTLDDYKLRDLVGIFSRWRWLALGAFLGVLLPGLAVTLLMLPLYEATALLLVDRPTLSSVYSVKPGQSLEAQPMMRSVNREEEVKTVAETLRTRAMVVAVVDELKIDRAALNRIRDFRRHVQALIDWVIETAQWLYAEAKYLTGLSTRPTAEELAFLEREELLDAVAKRLGITPLPDTNVLRVSFRSSDPKLAQAALNLYVTKFVNGQQRIDQASKAHFAEELRMVTGELRVAEAALADFRSRNSSYAGTTQRDMLLNALEAIRADWQRTDALHAQRAGQLGDLRARQWTDPHTQREVAKALVDAQVEIAGLAAKNTALRKAMAERQKELDAITQASVRIRELERDVARAEEAFSLRQRNFEQARVVASMAEANMRHVRVVDLAAYPLSPVRPRSLLYLGIALGAALLAALALPLVAHMNDTTLSSEAELAELLGTPVVVSLGQVRRPDARPWPLLLGRAPAVQGRT
jgi:uncharacterized protein involved in exopolysaccharide biosynthesis